MTKNLSIKFTLIFMIFFMSALMTVIGYKGLSGMSDVNVSLKSVYENRLVPTGQIAQIDELMQASIIQLNLAAMHDPRLEESVLHDHPITLHTGQVQDNIHTIAKLWNTYRAASLTEQEKKLAAEDEKRQENFVQQGLRQAIGLYEQGQFKTANMHMVKVVNPAFAQSRETAQALLQLQLDVARKLYKKNLSDYHFSGNLTVTIIVVSIILVVAVGFFLIRAIVNPLNQIIQHFQHLAAGDLSREVIVASHNEIGRVLAGLQDMQNQDFRFVFLTLLSDIITE